MSSSLVPSLLAFFVVIAMIPGVLWLVKGAQKLRPGGNGPLGLVAGLSLGPRERIVVIHADDRYLVVGITAQQMTLLANLDTWPDSHESPANGASGSTLGSQFARLLRRTESHDANRPSA